MLKSFTVAKFDLCDTFE